MFDYMCRWACLGIFFASLSRTNVDRTASLEAIRSGQFVEAAPSVIQCIFLFFGSTFFLFIKAKLGAKPFLIATILACICLDVCLCTASLYPYPLYDIGRLVVVPIAFHSALAIFFAATVWPSTVTTQYTTSLRAILDPISTFLSEHRRMLQMEPSASNLPASVELLRSLVNKSETGCAAASAWFPLLQRDILWGRFAPADVGGLQWWTRRIITNAQGLNIYYTLIEPTREAWPRTPGVSIPGTRAASPVASSRNSIVQTPQQEDTKEGMERMSSPLTNLGGDKSFGESVSRRRNVGHELESRLPSPLHTTFTRHIRDAFRKRHPHERHRQRSVNHDDHWHFSLLQLAHTSLDHQLKGAGDEGVVGVFESHRYHELESTRLAPMSLELTGQFTQLLSDACDEILGETKKALDGFIEWLAELRTGVWESRGREDKRRKDRLAYFENAKSKLDMVVETFRKDKR